MAKLEQLIEECNELELIITELEEELSELQCALELDGMDEDFNDEAEYEEDIKELIVEIECYEDELQLIKDKIKVIRGKGVDNG